MEDTDWQRRLTELIDEHDVPAAALGIWAGGRLTTGAAGVLNRATGVPATPDSLFQIGSITKVYTATVVMRLVADGRASLDTPVADILPDFRVADPDASRRITLEHLLTHTSGIDGDFFHDTGRGDDCLERYVADCADLAQNHPVGAMFSYCNSGFVILGRVIERLTGSVWDRALVDLLVGPLGAGHTHTLPEDVLRFRAALGHLTGRDGGPPSPSPLWTFSRSLGPAGLICATAEDVLAFARLHLAGGDGVLPAAVVADMQHPRVRLSHPDASAWGLGWARYDWGGERVIGHDGDTIGQSAALRVVPDADVAVVVLTNSDRTRVLRRTVLREVLDELCGIAVPDPVGPPDVPVDLAVDGYLGVYERAGERLELTADGGRLWLRGTPTGRLVGHQEGYETEVVPAPGDLLVGRPPTYTEWVAWHLERGPDGRRYLHDGARATPQVGYEPTV